MELLIWAREHGCVWGQSVFNDAIVRGDIWMVRNASFNPHQGSLKKSCFHVGEVVART